MVSLMADYHKCICMMKYNFLTLPKSVQFRRGDRIEYVYDAAGVKWQTTHKVTKTDLNYGYWSLNEPSASDFDANKTVTTDYVGNKIYVNNQLKFVLTEEGYIEKATGSATYTAHYYLNDRLGNRRIVIDAAGTVKQVNNYYPSGTSMAERRTDQAVQPYKFGGKELDRTNNLDFYDFIARGYDPVLMRFTRPDPLAEKYPGIGTYVYCANNPIKYVDLRGDSLTLAGSNLQETLNAIYHGLADGTNISMKFNNGVLDPTSIQEQAQNTTDFFLQDLYEIAINPTMLELSTSKNNTYMMNGKKIVEAFDAPSDVNTSDFGTQYEDLLKSWGEPLGRYVHGNLGQTLIPGNVSASGKSSTNNNVQVIINGRGSLNHRTVGIAHEFGHVVLYFRGLPYGHTQPGVDMFVYGRSTKMSKRLGYDF